MHSRATSSHVSIGCQAGSRRALIDKRMRVLSALLADGNDVRRPREKPQLVADELRRMIVAGEFKDGELLGQEPELIDRFGVSRPSLREALRILETEGLISVVRGARG